MALGEFAQTIPHLAVIQKDLPVGSDARKVVSAWRIPHVQGELGVRLDRLASRRGRGVRLAQPLRLPATGMAGRGARLTR